MSHPDTRHDSPLIVGVGSALVDILLQESDSFLSRWEVQKGGMTLVDSLRIEAMVKDAAQSPAYVPGGSACNTILGVGKLQGRARFIGKRGDDDLGSTFERSLQTAGVEPRLMCSQSATGRVLSIITPDAQRSMCTFLGAASEARAQELDPQAFEGAAIVHIEGYLLFNKELIMAALEHAHRAGARISLDLASYTVVEASHDILQEIITRYRPIILANEDEARTFTGHSDEEQALAHLATLVDTAVVKMGKRGSLISDRGTVYRIGIQGDGRALDTTGAGDLWAAGFLFGLSRNLPIPRCGEIAAACGFEVCQVIGASIPPEGWERIHQLCAQML